MKKIIAIAALTAALASSSAFAKTEGNYVGVSFLKSSATNRFQISGNQDRTWNKFSDTSNGVGIDYKHAYNFDGAYVSPGVFFDQIGSKATDAYNDNLTISSRYGAKLDLGYDFTDYFSAYFTNGIANTNYQLNVSNYGGALADHSTASKMVYFYGAGVTSKISKDLSLVAEYNTQTLNIGTLSSGVDDHIKSKLGVAKIGLAYNF